MNLGYSNHAIMQFGSTALFDGTGPFLFKQQHTTNHK